MGQPSLSPGRQRIGKTRGLAEPDSLALAPRRDPDGCQYSVSSCCGEVVRVQEAAESVASLELLDSGERGWWRRWLGCDGWAAAERSVRALGVVSAGINRHGEGDERVLHRRSSDPRWPRVMRWRS